jgi:hypothetical protein
MIQSLMERYEPQIAGTLSCYDRVVIAGTLPQACYPAGMTQYLHSHAIPIFDYPNWANGLREQVRERAEALAGQAGIEIEHISRSGIRKEDVVARVLQQRGKHPGLVHVLSAMESCSRYQPWCNKATGEVSVKRREGKCLHYYFYFMDPEFGLVHLRVPTWAPFRLQFCCNGHSWLAHQLAAAGIGYRMVDNAFTWIDDWGRAQQLADSLVATDLHHVLDEYAALCCPVADVFNQTYHWSLMEVEYATDLAFRSSGFLQPVYEQLIRQTVLTVKAEQIATFLGRRITPQLAQEVGTFHATRPWGTCVKHRFGQASIKMYDKAGIVLRIETTANDVSFFKHHRQVEHRNGPPTTELAEVRKTIYSLMDLRAGALTALCSIDPLRGPILLGCNHRYLTHLSALDDFSGGVRALDRLTKPREVDGKTVKGVNFFAPGDKALLHALQDPKANIAGIRRGELLPVLEMFSPSGLSRQLRRLLDLRVIKRVAGTYRYYLTKAGRAAIAAGERLTEAIIIPAMA